MSEPNPAEPNPLDALVSRLVREREHVEQAARQRAAITAELRRQFPQSAPPLPPAEASTPPLGTQPIDPRVLRILEHNHPALRRDPLTGDWLRPGEARR